MPHTDRSHARRPPRHGPHDVDGPLLPSGSRGFVALQRALGNRVALDLDYEVNLAPRAGSSNAVCIGLVWIVKPGH